MMLLAVLALQIQSDLETEARALAGQWVADAPSRAELLEDWATADADRRDLMAEAARHHKGTVALAVLEAAQADARMASRPRWRRALQDVALLNGLLPGEGPLSAFHEEATERFAMLLEGGWLPAPDDAADVLADAELRGPTLRAWAAQPARYPGPVPADPADWADSDRLIYTLLDARRAPESIPEAAADWFRAIVQPGIRPSDRALAVRLLEALAPDLPGDALAATWEALPAPSRTLFLPVLESAPLALAWRPCRELALDPAVDVDTRAAAVRRLHALDGPRAGGELLNLIGPSTPAPVLHSLLFGLRDWGDARACDILEVATDSLPSGARGLALEVLALHGDGPQTRQWQQAYDGLVSRERRGVLRAAMMAGQAGVLEDLWRTVNGPPGELRTDAETVLREFLKEPALVAGFDAGLANLEDADARMEQVQRIARLRTPAAATAVRRALSDPLLATHPDAFSAAGRLLEDEASRPMFRSWWNREVDVDANARFTAAVALAPVEEDAAEHVREGIFAADQTLLLGVVTLFRNNPTVANLAAARTWMFDERLPDMVRREFAATLPLSLEASEAALWETHAALRDMEQRTRLGLPIDMVYAGMIQACYAHGDAPVLDHVDRVLALARRARLAGADVLEQRIEPQRALKGRPGYDTDACLARVMAGLRFPGAPAPESQEPSAPPLLREHGAFASALQLLASRPAEEVVPRLREALQAEPGAWHPDLLWLAANRLQRPMPEASEVLASALRELEPAHSARVAATEPALPEPHLERNPQRFFMRLQDAVMTGELEEADRWLAAGMLRHRGDRRVWQWQGWVQIARGLLDEAETSFRRADRLGGTTPYLHMEQTLGLAVIAELRDPASAELESFLDYEEQAARLLALRLPVAARPDLEVLVPPGALDN